MDLYLFARQCAETFVSWSIAAGAIMTAMGAL
jgi:hypothetical protein